MARRTFFSFQYEDVTRAMVVRKSWVTQDRSPRGFADAAEFEKLERQGEKVVKAWIDDQLTNTSVTVVLVGAGTNLSKYVKYEIERSEERGNGLLGIDVSKVRDLNGNTSAFCGRMPSGYSFYRWNHDEGYKNIGAWIEQAAKDAGR